jgi:hypothetical protein
MGGPAASSQDNVGKMLTSPGPWLSVGLLQRRQEPALQVFFQLLLADPDAGAVYPVAADAAIVGHSIYAAFVNAEARSNLFGLQ